MIAGPEKILYDLLKKKQFPSKITSEELKGLFFENSKKTIRENVKDFSRTDKQIFILLNKEMI